MSVTLKDESVKESAIHCFAASKDGTAIKALSGTVSGNEITFDAGDKSAKIFIWDDMMRPITESYGK